MDILSISILTDSVGSFCDDFGDQTCRQWHCSLQQNVFVDIQQQKCVQMLLAAAAAVRVLHISQRRVTVLYSCSSDWRLTSSRRSMVLTFGKNTGSHDSSVLICKWERMCFDVVLKTRVLVSSHLEDKNENLGVGLGS